MLADHNLEFYQYLHLGVKVAENFTQGEIIDPDPSIVRILWQGLVEPVLPELSYNRRKMHKESEGISLFLPRHSMIINDQFADPLLNVMCHDGQSYNLIFFEIEFDRLEELLTKSRKE